MSRTEDLERALKDLRDAVADALPRLRVRERESIARATRGADNMLDPPPSGYPVHDQLARVSDGTHAVGDFLDWIGSAYGVQLCVWVDGQQEFVPLGLSRETLIGKWSGIDPGELHAEKRAMLNQLRERAS